MMLWYDVVVVVAYGPTRVRLMCNGHGGEGWWRSGRLDFYNYYALILPLLTPLSYTSSWSSILFHFPPETPLSPPFWEVSTLLVTINPSSYQSCYAAVLARWNMWAAGYVDTSSILWKVAKLHFLFTIKILSFASICKTRGTGVEARIYHHHNNLLLWNQNYKKAFIHLKYNFLGNN